MTEKEKDDARVPGNCLDMVKEAIGRAKEEKLHAKRARRRTMIRMVAVSFIGLMVILPNVSMDVAQAMSSLPVLGSFFDVITIIDYHYMDDRFSADVDIPEIKSDSEAAGSINGKISAIAEEWVREFESAKADECGRAEIKVGYEILSTAPEYFTLKLMTYQGAGSGFQQNHYYTIRISDEKEMALSDLFPENADFITPKSENIKEQMRQQVKEDAGKCYWVDLEDDDPAKGFEFSEIEKDQQFYINENGQLVVTFNEGDVAPMYMGCVQFTIPEQVTDGIR